MPPSSLTGHSAHLLARATETCTTQVCQDAAAAILHDLDLNADPCSDFYQYTCGGWIQDAKIPDSEPAVGTFTNLRNANLDGLGAMLQGSYDDLLQGATQHSKTLLRADQTEKDRENFNKVKIYYDTCMDEESINKLGPTPIYPEIANLISKLGYQDAFSDNKFTTDDVSRFTDTIIQLITEGVNNHLFAYAVGPDDMSPEEIAVAIYQPSFGLPSREYYEQPEILEKYRDGLINLVMAILGEPSNESPTANIRREKLAEENLTMLAEADAEAMVDRFLKFETHLAKLTLPKDQLQNPIELYNPMPVSELQEKYKFIDWNLFLSHFTPNGAAVPESIIITSPRFMQALDDWFMNSDGNQNDVTARTILDFFTIKTILANVQDLDKDTREVHRAMTSSISSGTTAPPLRERVCITATSKAFGQLLGRYFVIKNFGGEPQREQAARFMDNIQEAWSERLDVIDWLDEETRTRALEKVNKIGHKEAYSTVRPDVRSPDSLFVYYANIDANPTSYYNNQKSTKNWELTQEWDQLGKNSDKDVWYMDPHEVNAYYTPTFNEIVIPAGILQNPFYHSDLPQYLNYGGIGVVIGHEITHAFDNSGRLYDGDGRLNAWWTNHTTEAFEEKSQCFVNQYNKFSVEGPNGVKHNVNGKMTLGENLADNGGVNAALMAMHKSLKENPEDNLALPQLETLSPEQLFFINFGRVWCSNTRPEMAVQRVRNDVHSPAQVRVNAAVQNSPDFAKAFNCPAEEQKPMDPADKCQIW